MKPIIKSIEINAPREKVWSALWEGDNYLDWSKFFNPVGYMEGTLALGEKIRFIGKDETTGEIGGLLCKITEFVPNEVIVFTILGVVVNGSDITEGPGIEEWVGLKEQYHLTESGGVTTLAIDTFMSDEHYDMMVEAWDRGLARVKEIAE